MGFLDAFALLGLLVVGLPIAAALGWLLATLFRAPWLRPVPLVVLLATVVGGVPLALRFAGVQADARVLVRDERVTVNARDGSWSNTRSLQVRYRPATPRRADPTSQSVAHDSVNGAVRVDAATYDRTPVGAIVPITYVAVRPSLVKFADRSLGDDWRELREVGGVVVGLTLVAAVLLGVAVWSWSPRVAVLGAVRRVALTACVIVVVVAGARAALTSPAHGPDVPVPAGSTAHVAAISTFVSCWYCSSTSNRLEQPFEVVTLEFTPSGARFPIRTADAIDTGSVRGLVDGAAVHIHYAPEQPRAARIDGATRTFEVRNGRDTILFYAVFWGVVGVSYLAIATLARRYRRTRRGAVRP